MKNSISCAEIMSEKAEQLLASILEELKADADECEYYRVNGSANPTTFDIIDFLGLLGHPVKGYTIKNDGAASLLIGHNMTPGSIDPNLDVNSTRFSSIFAGENREFKSIARKFEISISNPLLATLLIGSGFCGKLLNKKNEKKRMV